MQILSKCWESFPVEDHGEAEGETLNGMASEKLMKISAKKGKNQIK